MAVRAEVPCDEITRAGRQTWRQGTSGHDDDRLPAFVEPAYRSHAAGVGLLDATYRVVSGNEVMADEPEEQPVAVGEVAMRVPVDGDGQAQGIGTAQRRRELLLDADVTIVVAVEPEVVIRAAAQVIGKPDGARVPAAGLQLVSGMLPEVVNKGRLGPRDRPEGRAA